MATGVAKFNVIVAPAIDAEETVGKSVAERPLMKLASETSNSTFVSNVISIVVVDVVAADKTLGCTAYTAEETKIPKTVKSVVSQLIFFIIRSLSIKFLMADR